MKIKQKINQKIRQLKKNNFLLYFILFFLLTGFFTGCSNGTENQGNLEDEQLSSPVKIAALKGPSGIGMVQLMEESEKYQVTIYQSPDEVVGKVITGEADIASLPPNLAAVLYNKTEGQISALATNTLGVLYIVEHGSTVSKMSDLKDKTIIASGKGGATEFILNRLLLDAGIDPTADVTIQWLANHTDVASTLLSREDTVALLPEPFVSVVMNKSTAINMAIDLNEAWNDTYQIDLTMGTLIAQNTFIENRNNDLKIFMDDYKDSVEFVNSNYKGAAELISKHGIIDDKTVAEAAIPKCNIVVIDDINENKQIQNQFFEILYQMEPKSVGGQIPDEGFYYKWIN